VTDDDDAEPLDGDIGPAPGSREGRRADAAEELRRYEAEREERRRRTNAVAERLVLILVALFLGFLVYDSIVTALEAHRRDDPWLYPPATIAAACLTGLVALAAWTARRRR
jgi:peptidoglycan/LPS O-acetylase OafA/YrhL